jgi:uncharacterized protein (DUF2062 family)
MARGQFMDVFFVLTFMCGKFHLISGWNQFKNKVTQGLEQIALQSLWPPAAAACPVLSCPVLTVAPVSCLEISFCFY